MTENIIASINSGLMRIHLTQPDKYDAARGAVVALSFNSGGSHDVELRGFDLDMVIGLRDALDAIAKSYGYDN